MHAYIHPRINPDAHARTNTCMYYAHTHTHTHTHTITFNHKNLTQAHSQASTQPRTKPKHQNTHTASRADPAIILGPPILGPCFPVPVSTSGAFPEWFCKIKSTAGEPSPRLVYIVLAKLGGKSRFRFHPLPTCMHAYVYEYINTCMNACIETHTRTHTER